jgi:endonuclease/exonuclease/phosphatase (EEP) superfamily protein YafD
MHVYSQLPVLESQTKFLVEPDEPSMHALIQLPSGEPVRIHFLHPSPPSPTENEASSERDAELLVVAKSVAHSKRPVIVTGDLNDVAWSETTRLFRKISGLLDPRVGRGMFNTFHADYWFMRWPLDHLFHSSHFRLSKIRRLPRFGSDHFALFTELSYEPEHETESNGLEADKADRRWANQKTNAQDVSRNDVPQP